ncbi:ATP synthase subunit delta [Georgfuchsia toluolica]|uniref:ATP synthase subunit delta n=1 Tax=Georgfuchsia toluolica TaxID=424218 RepID=A0A916J4K8_9PROT|nr:F0F1 ATP synthase subunit delta [Georgfuchsia toluolica]CAG4884467.1 ATP synthase subunit delta [Georgfuchsia toluolica]
MAENVTLARPYAEAAFQLAKADPAALSAWSQTLGRMAAVASDAEMQECIANPQLDSGQLEKLFAGVVGDNLSAEQQNFVRVLIDNDRLGALPEIAQLFNELKNGHDGVKVAAVESAFPMDDAAVKALVVDIERKFQCKINATVRVVPELIGGVRIAVGDEVIDASVRGKLAAMASALKS